MDNRYQFAESRHDIFIFNENIINRENPHLDFKLHFSLSWKDFRAHSTDIIKIIVKYLEQGVIDIYKYVQPTLVGDQYFDWIAGKIKPFHPITGKLLYHELTPSQERFVRSDQFTIYIPYTYDRDKIAKLCMEVDAYMIQHGLQPGEKSDIAVNITPYINMRLEYIHTGEDKVRIDALPMYDKNPQERPRYQSSVIENELFQYLYGRLHSEVLQRDVNSAFDDSEADAAILLDKQNCTVERNKKAKKSFKKNASSFFTKIFKKSDKPLEIKNQKGFNNTTYFTFTNT